MAFCEAILLLPIFAGGSEVIGTLRFDASEPPQCIFHAFRDDREVFPSKDDFCCFPPNMGQSKVMEPVVKLLNPDKDLNLLGVGQTGDSLPSSLGDLREVDYFFGVYANRLGLTALL